VAEVSSAAIGPQPQGTALSADFVVAADRPDAMGFLAGANPKIRCPGFDGMEQKYFSLRELGFRTFFAADRGCLNLHDDAGASRDGSIAGSLGYKAGASRRGPPVILHCRLRTL
jgi:hypothetical protein